VRPANLLLYRPAVQTIAERMEAAGAAASLTPVAVPDLWQQQAVAALRAGQDVVVQAPTGAGKTLVFEAWSNYGRPRGQAIYTVPTRALANDKLAEWRARGWNVGIATGDLAENLDAPVLVATLETQKNRLIQGDGPALLVIDEYQMLGDEDRGLNYELAIALAPPQTQLLLLSGSVANPHHIVQWLTRLGRKATLVRHEIRPVPLEEVFVEELNWHLPSEIRSHWARLCAKALAENLGPVLLFAPRRQSAESIAADLARQLPTPNPLQLSEAQRRLVGDHLARLLKSRIAYHHSGLSYAARAGVIEPLAKAGQLRLVVATMGLAAGINFSLRSVAVTANTYKRDGLEVPLRPDEVLQMFGRAGRRGLDETGYVLVSPDDLRMRDGRPAHLSRSTLVDWSALLTLMHAAAEQGKSPFVEAMRVQERLFTTKPIFLGVESSLKHPDAVCGLHTDAERARHVRRRVRELLNSRGEWQPYPPLEERPLHEIRVPFVGGKRSTRVRVDERVEDAAASSDATDLKRTSDGLRFELKPLLMQPDALENFGSGELLSLASGEYGRAVKVAERYGEDEVRLSKWIRKLTNWSGRETHLPVWRELVVPLVERGFRAQHLPVLRFIEEPHQILALLSLGEQTAPVPVDVHGIPLWKPREREVFPEDCARCSLVPVCKALTAATGTALLWRRLKLVEADGRPTPRGRVVSFFSGGDGLAVAAALEDESYPLDELVYDLANLDANFRFSTAEDRWGGRLAVACRRAFGNQSITGYLENGLPPKYGSGAETVVQLVHKNPANKFRFVTEVLGDGDIDRVIIEWRSLLRQITHAPALDWPRWTALQSLAKAMLHSTESPTMTDLPPLEPFQTRRVDHQLKFRRH
jgi:superfamily II DNA/RNA helicase